MLVELLPSTIDSKHSAWSNAVYIPYSGSSTIDLLRFMYELKERHFNRDDIMCLFIDEITSPILPLLRLPISCGSITWALRKPSQSEGEAKSETEL